MLATLIISYRYYLLVLPRNARNAKRGMAIVGRPSVCPSLNDLESPFCVKFRFLYVWSYEA